MWAVDSQKRGARLFLPLLACSQPTEPAPGPGWPLAPATNVLILQVDTLRANHLALYGYDRDPMPLLASRPWAIIHGYSSASSWTLPSVAAVFSGLEVHHHGLRYIDDARVLHDPLVAPTLAESFAAGGYATGFFTGNASMGEDTGLRRGFETFGFVRPQTAESNLEQMLPSMEGWLDTHDEPFLLMLQPMDPHIPYSPLPEDRGTFATDVPFDEDAPKGDQEAEIAALWEAGSAEDRAVLTDAVRGVYDEQLLGLDRAIDAMLEKLAHRHLLDHTLVILTADHGETLDEEGDGRFGHGTSVREELVTVPLLFLGPGVPAGDYDCPSASVDLLPTLLALQGLPALEGLDGESRLGGCRDFNRATLLSDGIPWFTAATETARVSWQCTLPHEEKAWDRTEDPFALTPVPADTLADGPTLQAELQRFVDDTETACP